MITTLERRYATFTRYIDTIEALALSAKRLGHRELTSISLQALLQARDLQTKFRDLLDQDAIARTKPVPELLSPAPGTNNEYVLSLRGKGRGSYLMKSGKWKAKASYKGQSFHLGYYPNEAEAHAAYRAFWLAPEGHIQRLYIKNRPPID